MQAPYFTFLLDSTYTHAVVNDKILRTYNYTRIAIRYTSYTIDQKLFSNSKIYLYDKHDGLPEDTDI